MYRFKGLSQTLVWISSVLSVLSCGTSGVLRALFGRRLDHELAASAGFPGVGFRPETAGRTRTDERMNGQTLS